MFTHTTGDCLSVEQIAEHYGVTVGQVHAAPAYYHLHKEEIDEQIRRDDEEADRLHPELDRQGELLRG
jgi:hypothetical protein